MAQGIIYRFNSKKIDRVLNDAKQSNDEVIGSNGSVKLGSAGKVMFVNDNTIQINKDEGGNEIYNPDIVDDKWTQIEPDKTLEQRVKSIEDLHIKTRLEELEKVRSIE